MHYTFSAVFDKINSLFNSINNIIAPPLCLICDSVIEEKSTITDHICNKCYHLLPPPLPPRVILERVCSHFPNADFFVDAFSLYDSGTNKEYLQLIHLIKYTKYRKFGFFLGKELGKRIIEARSEPEKFFDLIVPVPIHCVRKRERGFNQAEVIGSAISQTTGIPLKNSILKRIRYTTSQTSLSLEQRKQNVANVFVVEGNPTQLKGKSIILVDDVLTTGSTLYHCGKKLIEAGAKDIAVAVLTTA